jgi:PHP family Zn ribbon phosphoesterase
VSLSPKETIHHNYLCPVCGKRMTVGVMHRVEKLADRNGGAKPDGAPGYTSIIPLPEIIGEALQAGPASKKVNAAYCSMLEKLGSEFTILMDAPLGDIRSASSPVIAEAVSRMREGKVHIAPGYDGEYGKIRIFEEAERKEIKGQMTLL